MKISYETKYYHSPSYALFLDSAGKVVRYDSTYIVDGDSEIKPGATLLKQLDTYEAFDTVEVYLTGSRGVAEYSSNGVKLRNQSSV